MALRSAEVFALRVCALVVAGGAVAGQDAIFFRDARARDLFTSGRIAVFGAPGGIARLRSLVFKGTSRIASSDGSLAPGTVEIRVLLPDRYVRIDSGAYGRRQSGYASGSALNVVETSDGRRAVSPDDAGILQADRAELARLMLGATCYASEELALTLQTRDTLIEMPGDADALGVDAVGGKGFTARVVFDGKTHLPSRLIYWGANRTVLTAALLDRKPIAGIRLPHRIVTTAGDRVVDELSFDQIIVNAPLTKSDFAR